MLIFFSRTTIVASSTVGYLASARQNVVPLAPVWTNAGTHLSLLLTAVKSTIVHEYESRSLYEILQCLCSMWVVILKSF